MICYVVGFPLRGNPRSLFFPRRSGGGVTRDRGVRRSTAVECAHESAASRGWSHVGRFSLGRKSVPLLNTFSVVVVRLSSSSFEGKSRSLDAALFSSLPPMPPPPLNHCTITSAAAARALPSLRRHEWYHLFQFCSCVQEMTGVYNTKIR